MAHEVKVSCYIAKTRKSRTKNEEADYIPFTEVSLKQKEDKDVEEKTNQNNNSISFTNLFRKFIESFDGKFKGIKGRNYALYLPENEAKFSSEQEIIYGFVQSGQTGTGGSVKELDNPNNEVFTITPDHVTSNEYFFLVWLPNNNNRGLVMVQGLSTVSPADLFCKLFKHFFSHIAEGQVMVLDRHVPNETIKQMREKGEIDVIRLKKNMLPPDKANTLIGGSFIERPVEIEIKISNLKWYTPEIKEILKNWFEGEAQFYTTPLIDLGMGELDDILVQYEHNGKTFTSKQSQGFQIKPHFYVEESEIVRDPTTKLPTKESIESYCLNLFQALKKELLSESKSK